MRIRYLSLVISMLIMSSVVMTQTTPSSAADFNKAVEVGSAQDNRPEFVIAVLGDSYASGEGAPDVHGHHSVQGDIYAAECLPYSPYGRCFSETWWSPDSWFSNRLAVFPQQDDPGWQDAARRCHRSSKGPAVHAAMIIAARFPDIKITVIDFACGGSKITDGLLIGWLGPEPDPGAANLPSQLAALEAYVKDRGGGVDAIVMNIGGNDARFADIIQECILYELPDCTTVPLLIEVGELLKDRTTPEFPDELAPLRARYTVLDAAFRDANGRVGLPGLVRARPSEVYLTGPPNASHDALPSANTAANPEDYCDGTQTSDAWYNNVTRGEAEAMEDLLGGAENSMRAAMRLAANRHGWIFINMFDLSKQHGVCADNKSFFRTNKDALRIQGDEGLAFVFDSTIPVPTFFIAPGIAHQNEDGYAARANLIANAVGEQVRMQFRAPILSLARIEAGIEAGFESHVSFEWRDPSFHLPETYWQLNITENGSLRRVFSNDLERHKDLTETETYANAGVRILQWRVAEAGEFTARVRACRETPTGFYCGPFSNAVTVATFVPGTPVGLEMVGRTYPNTIGVQWTPGPRTPISVRYEVVYGPYGARPCPPGPLSGGICGFGMVNTTINSTTSTTFRLQSPTPSSKYVFTVRACSTAGCSPYTLQLVCSTRACSPYTPLVNP